MTPRDLVVSECSASPKGIKNLDEKRISFILKAKERRQERKAEIFKPSEVMGWPIIKEAKTPKDAPNIDRSQERTMTAPNNLGRKQAIAKALQPGQTNF